MNNGTKYYHPTIEASKMLEAALQQMDGIIQGAQMELSSQPDRSISPPLGIVSLCEKLKSYIQFNADESELDEINDDTRQMIVDHLSCSSKKNIDDRLIQLENDKESLQLQVSVLSEQVEVQNDKIRDMEHNLELKKSLLSKTENERQKETIARSSLETQRLELLNEISNLKLRLASLERENFDLRDQMRLVDLSLPNNRTQAFNPEASSTPYQCYSSSRATSADFRQWDNLSSLSRSTFLCPSNCSLATLSNVDLKEDHAGSLVLGLSSPLTQSLLSLIPSRTPPANARRKIDQFGTLPRRHQRDIVFSQAPGPPPSTNSLKTSSVGNRSKALPTSLEEEFGKDSNGGVGALSPCLLGGGLRSSSAPNLAETERMRFDAGNSWEPYSPPTEIRRSSLKKTPVVTHLQPQSSTKSYSAGSKPSGLKKIFTKLRRSTSGHLESNVGDVNDLRRGGLRATATARLGWTSQGGCFREPPIPFSSWSCSMVVDWLGHLGLSHYGEATKCWMVGQKHISKATAHQLEKDLGLRHPLHRKKLQLAIANRVSKGSEISQCAARLDCAWVLRWLDDLGLPQYKEVFEESRVDGLVLHFLTYDDLSFLKVSSLLHVTSIKRGIQVLRDHGFDPYILKRRSSPGDLASVSSSQVAVWSNHRVMEWLKTVDLSEYAPNLRGSGVHGALMIYEVRFTAEFLASLLSIPSSKTLLRRHLSTHFKDLVGRQVVQVKRAHEASPGFVPLSATAKIKTPSKSQFSLKRRKAKDEIDDDDLVCPMDTSAPSFNGIVTSPPVNSASQVNSESMHFLRNS